MRKINENKKWFKGVEKESPCQKKSISQPVKQKLTHIYNPIKIFK